VFTRIIEYHHKDAYEKFEEISALVKRTHLNFNDPKGDFELNNLNLMNDPKQISRNLWLTKCKDLINEVSFGNYSNVS
jgi:hypothetical protein